MGNMNSPKTIWDSFTPSERKTIAIYIAGIMFYKFGLEAFNGSIVAMATILFDRQADQAGRPRNTFYQIGVLTGLNQATQCVGAILVAPLIKKMPTRTVLAGSVLIFGVITAILLIVDVSTGGTFKPDGVSSSNPTYFGDWNPKGLYPLYTISGVAYGCIELIRRVIPRDIVGGDVRKLKRMDATVHIMYEVAGTAGAFASTALITDLGNNRSFLITPIFFGCAAAIWSFIGPLNFKKAEGLSALEASHQGPGSSVVGYFKAVAVGCKLFVLTLVRGAYLVFGHRHLIWLFPTYSIALYAHRYLENAISPAFARRALGTSAWSQIMVGGSNFGELLGALFVFVFTDVVKTPLPWLRLDALMLVIVWVFGYINPIRNVRTAWKLAAVCIPISFGWAAGDVSLAAYVQSRLASGEHGEEGSDVSDLGAVMSLLYSSYIVLYAILNSQLGTYIDKVVNDKRSVQVALRMVGGVQFSVIAVVILLATLIPRGGFAFNPSLIEPDSLVIADEENSDLGPKRSEKEKSLQGSTIEEDEKRTSA